MSEAALIVALERIADPGCYIFRPPWDCISEEPDRTQWCAVCIATNVLKFHEPPEIVRPSGTQGDA